MNDEKPPNMDITTIPYEVPESIELKIGSTTYIANAKYKEDSKEGLMDKL